MKNSKIINQAKEDNKQQEQQKPLLTNINDHLIQENQSFKKEIKYLEKISKSSTNQDSSKRFLFISKTNPNQY